jgi:uncharacterized membrane protein
MLTRERILGPSLWLLVVGIVDIMYNHEPVVSLAFIGAGIVGVIIAWFSPVSQISKRRKLLAITLWLLLLGYFVWYTVTHGGVF